MLKMILQPVSVCVGLLLRVRLRLSQKLTEDAALKKKNISLIGLLNVTVPLVSL